MKRQNALMLMIKKYGWNNIGIEGCGKPGEEIEKQLRYL